VKEEAHRDFISIEISATCPSPKLLLTDDVKLSSQREIHGETKLVNNY
jgi:hypothetical protein